MAAIGDGQANDSEPRSTPWGLILSSLAIANVSGLEIILQPAVIAEFVARRGISESTSGMIATAEMAIMSIGIFAWTHYVRRFRYLPVTLVGIALIVTATLASILVQSTPLLLTSRVVAAMGFALVTLVPNMSVARLPNAGSIFGWMYTSQLITGSVLLAWMPAIGSAVGRPPVFPSALLYILIFLPVMLLMPRREEAQAPAQIPADMPNAPRRAIFSLSAAIAMLSIGQLCIWVFLMVLAGPAGLSQNEASGVLAMSLIGAIGGSLMSAPAARWLGSFRLILVMMGVLAAALSVIAMGYGPTSFRIAAIIAQVAFYAIIPTIFGVAAQVDPSGKGAATVNASAMLFGSAGPYLGGVLSELTGPPGMIAVSLFSLAVAAYLFVRASHASAHRVRNGL